jgi:hypothetical protein
MSPSRRRRENASPRSAAEVLALLRKSRPKPLSNDDNIKRRAYRNAAAVLAALSNPNELRPAGMPGLPGEGERLLATELVAATGRRLDGRVMLRPEARRAAFAELRSIKSRREALEANPKERTGELQADFERYLLGNPLPVEDQSPKQLERTLQIALWLQGLLETLPRTEEVRERADYFSLLAPFEDLAGDKIFRGRRAELDELRSFVGVVEPDALLKRLSAKVMRWIDPKPAPALSLSGPGGIGKSALIARFMLEHTRLPLEARLPFAYLDFERPVLSISQPLSLIAEMIRQLDLQFAHENYFRKLRNYSIKMMDGESSIEREQKPGPAISLAADLTGILRVQLGPRPFIIILDTFEEVQYRGERLAFPFWELLSEMQERFPFLRVVISGRAPVTSLTLIGQEPVQLQLGELDQDAAAAFVQGYGIDKSLATILVKQVGGVPLSLKLAATAAGEEGEADSRGIKNLAGKSRFWFSTSDEIIQGTLYSRILGHIHDPVLERLAHPGLVLRRISPEVILEVLNKPCQLGISTIDEAIELFDKLRQETALVASDTLDGTLVHRSDLRRTMLKLLVEKAPAQADEIHRTAVDWYSKQSGWRAKAEELYHRLQLGDLRLDRFYEDPEVRSSLQASITEFSTSAQVFLASNGYDVAPEILEHASEDENDAAQAAQIEEYLPFGPSSVAFAQGIIDEHQKRLNESPILLRAAARIAAQRDRLDESLDWIEKGISLAFERDRPREILALLCDQAWLLTKKREKSNRLVNLVLRMGDYASRYQNVLAKLQFRLQLLTISDDLPKSSKIDANTIRHEILDLLSASSPVDIWNIFPVIGAASVDLLQFPEVMRRILELIADPESPFLKVSLYDEGAQAAFRTFSRQLTIFRSRADFSDTIYSGVQGIEELYVHWPFRVLRVRPPYSTETFESRVSS